MFKIRKKFLSSLLFIFSISFISCETEGMEIKEYFYIAADNIINPNSEYMVVIGDIQEYTNSIDFLPYLTYSLDWIRNQHNHYGNIKCVLQDGDVTWFNIAEQWSTGRNAFEHLGDSIMYVWSTGNHDYDWEGKDGVTITNRASSKLNEYGHNTLLDENIISEFENGRLDNIIVRNIVNNKRIDIISLEYGPRPEVIEWASEHVKNNQDKKFILMTHEFLTPRGEMVSNNGCDAAKQFEDENYTTPAYIWENLIKSNDNIICLVCGHNGFCRYKEVTNDAGRMVPMVLFNLQYQDNGGDSMIQLWEFPKNENKINITVYNTLKKTLHNPDQTTYSFSY